MAEAASQLEHADGAGGVVVGSVMDFVRAGHERAQSAAAQVIVVGADDDDFVLLRAFAFEHADDVFHLRGRAVDGGDAFGLPADERGAVRLHVLVDGRFELGDRFAEGRL